MLTNNADNIKSSSFNWMIENMLDLICQVSLEGTYEYLSLIPLLKQGVFP